MHHALYPNPDKPPVVKQVYVVHKWTQIFVCVNL